MRRSRYKCDIIRIPWSLSSLSSTQIVVQCAISFIIIICVLQFCIVFAQAFSIHAGKSFKSRILRTFIVVKSLSEFLETGTASASIQPKCSLCDGDCRTTNDRYEYFTADPVHSKLHTREPARDRGRIALIFASEISALFLCAKEK